MNKGKVIVVSGPSGVGKGTVVKELIGSNKDCALSQRGRSPRRKLFLYYQRGIYSKDK